MVKVATREVYGKALAELAKESKRILILDAGLSGPTKAGEVKKAAPKRRFSFSVAEGNMTVAAIGMATGGNIVFASTLAMFTVGRALEQVCNSICYPHLSTRVCVTHAGFTVGEDGASRQSVEDVALMRNIPGMVVISPTDGVETKAVICAVAKYDGPCYACLGGMVVGDAYTEGTLNFQIGKGNVIRKGNSVTPIATGIMVEAAVKAMDILKESGVDVTVVDVHIVKPIGEELIVELTKDHDLFVTCEEHSVTSDLGNAVAEVLSQGAPGKFTMVGIEDTFGESGTPAVLLERCGLTTNDIVKAVESNKQIIG